MIDPLLPDEYSADDETVARVAAGLADDAGEPPLTIGDLYDSLPEGVATLLAGMRWSRKVPPA